MNSPLWRSILLLALSQTLGLSAQPAPQGVVTADIDRFWQAYDRIAATPDTAEQRALLLKMYIEPGTPGLRAFMEARRYTPDDYLTAIARYPRFWASIRANTLRASTLGLAIAAGVEQLRGIYPALRPAPVYFVIGAFRSPGTVLNGNVLIGAELALGDSTTDLSEFPATFAHFKPYFAGNPVAQVAQLNVHEYVHTQQRDHEYVLLYRTLYEGIAEFVSVTAVGGVSGSPAIAYGRAHRERIRDRFAPVILSPGAVDDWFYNSADNEFGIRDLGYYVGYEIAERIYRRANDKRAAVARLVDLDYTDQSAVERLVDESAFFARPLRDEIARYEASRPTVTGLVGVKNGDLAASASLTQLTIKFSAPVAPPHRGFDFGPLGESNVLRIARFVGFADDGRSATIELAPLQSGKRYQMLVTDRFRTASGLPLVPYLIDFTTARR